jgi:hypothetical protein
MNLLQSINTSVDADKRGDMVRTLIQTVGWKCNTEEDPMELFNKMGDQDSKFESAIKRLCGIQETVTTICRSDDADVVMDEKYETWKAIRVQSTVSDALGKKTSQSASYEPDAPCMDHETKKIIGNYVLAVGHTTSEIKVDENFEHAATRYSYDIVGVIYFIPGDLPHYVAYIKKGGRWLKADDGSTNEIETIGKAINVNKQNKHFPRVCLYRRRVGTNVGRHEGVGEMAYGINNRGSTCFANALIQLLLNIPELITMWYVGENDSCGVASTLVGRNLKVKVGGVECIVPTQADEWLKTCGYEVKTGVSPLPITNERFVGCLVNKSNTLVPYAWCFQRLCKFDRKDPGVFLLADLDTADTSEIENVERYEIYAPFRTEIIRPMFKPTERMQTDGCNCGVFVCAYAYYLGQNQNIPQDLQPNINKFRKYIAHSILNGVLHQHGKTLKSIPFAETTSFSDQVVRDYTKYVNQKATEKYIIRTDDGINARETKLKHEAKNRIEFIGNPSTMARFYKHEWLDDEALRHFMSLLTKRANHDGLNYAFHNTLTTSNLIEDVNVDEGKIINRYKNLFVNSTKKKLYQKIFFAHNQSNNHYNLLFLELEKNKTYTIQVIDSLGTNDNDGLAREFKTAVDKIFFHTPQIYTVDFNGKTVIDATK